MFKTDFGIYAVLILLGFWIGLSVGEYYTTNEWHKWCIENDNAHYDTKTGELILHNKEYWNEQLKEVLGINPEDLEKIWKNEGKFDKKIKI